MELVYLFFLPVFFLDPFQNGMKTLLWKKTINILIFWLINFFHSFIFNLGFHHHFFKFLNHDKIPMISLVKKKKFDSRFNYTSFMNVHWFCLSCPFFFLFKLCVCMSVVVWFFFYCYSVSPVLCVCVYTTNVLNLFCLDFVFFLFKFLSWSKKYSDFFFLYK